MVAVTSFKGKQVALFGLGGSGIVTAQSLKDGGANIICFDDNPASVEKAASMGFPTADLRTVDFQKLDALILAPGVPLTHPQPHWSVELAKKANLPIIGDIELFAQERRKIAPNAPFVAITGTNGKSTSTALISHVLKFAGRKIFMGGNIGTAVLSAEEIDDEVIYVVEVSSYQVDIAPSLDPTIGILLNIAPDHLDRHGSMENYAEIKSRVPIGCNLAVIGVDDEYSKEIFLQSSKSLNHQTIAISMSEIEDGICFDGQFLIEKSNGNEERLFELSKAKTLRGKHNAQNAAAAWAACKAIGLTPKEICDGLISFPGLAHRLEQIGSVGNVLFVNDSKGTNSEAAQVALDSFENIYWIAGGLSKEGGIENLSDQFSHVKKAFLIGEAAPQFAATLGGNEVPFEISETLDVAVKKAAFEAANDDSNPVILLSPACASFDQFANFEIRGESFRAAVSELEGFVSYSDSQIGQNNG